MPRVSVAIAWASETPGVSTPPTVVNAPNFMTSLRLRGLTAMAPPSGVRLYDVLRPQRGQLVAAEPEPPAVDLLVVGAHRERPGVAHLTRRGGQPRHHAHHLEQPAERARHLENVVPRAHLGVVEDVAHARDARARHLGRVQPR